MNRQCVWAGLVVAAVASAVATTPAAAEYPERPIRMITPYSPGGTSDFVARIVGDGLTQELGQHVVVDNRAGAGSAIGTEIAAHATPDGYTVIINNIGLAVNETLRPDRGYRALQDLAPVSLVGYTPSVLVVNNAFPTRNMAEFVALAKKTPGKIRFGSAGAGSSTFLSMMMLQEAAGIELLHVPYKGGGPAVRAMMGNEVQCVMSPIPTVFGHIQNGRIRALAVSSESRSSALPDLPPVAETVPGYTFNTWYGLLTTGGTQQAVIERLNQATVKALQKPEVQEKLKKAGLDPQPTSPSEFRQIIASDIRKYGNVIQTAGIPKLK